MSVRRTARGLLPAGEESSALGRWSPRRALSARRSPCDHDLTVHRAVAAERARIARELHDIVSHHVSVMVAQASAVQASAVQGVLHAEPDQGMRALGSIEAVGREAMVQMRRMMGLLQPWPAAGVGVGQPGLDRLQHLLADVRRAGLGVELVIEGTPRPTAGALDADAYRIVQEALTNVRRHAGTSRAEVVIGYDDTVLRLRIRDDGVGARRESTAGHGLVGILQRVTLLGGRLAVGPRAEGGFEVAVDLPWDAAAP